jgi:hypothetical protein
MIHLLTATALACGGLFCEAPTSPIDQAGERIVFAIDKEAGRLEMHAQIAYEGPANQFAWLVPVPAVPELFLSTDELFSVLDAFTAPLFFLNQTSTCDDGANRSDDTDAPEGVGPVTVVASTAVGPYESVTLQADSAAAMIGWLSANGYYVPEGVEPYLAPYVAAGAYIVALRLQKDRTAGELAPIGLSFAGDTPTIPLTMTAVAATPDMVMIPWILGKGRAVPENYLHVVINELAIDWWSAGDNYSAVVGRAADVAGGQAFATDFAGTTAPMRWRLVWAERFRVEELRASTTVRSLWGAILQQGFVVDERLLGLMRRYFPDSDAVYTDVSRRPLELDLDCDVEGEPGCEVVDTGPAVDGLVAEVIAPLERAEALFHRFPYATRLTSSASPAEMTLDPRFVINRDLPDVPRTRMATFEAVDCDNDGFSRLTLSDGRWVDVPVSDAAVGGPTPWQYLSAAFSDLPVLRIESTGRSGAPVVLVDASGQIDAVRASLRSGGDDGCGAGGCDGTGGAGAPAAALALLAARRRRAR